ncbi:PepSY domain-containing protein [Roseibium sp. SCP14]|uniref:PepSY domain-containing protein n=1 Tax=Roseibium sp. SCP14 TaxID=3141375 RepID=UPI003339CDA8
MKQIFAFLILTFLAVLPAEAACLSQAQAREAVASGRAAPLGSVAGRAGGEIVKAQLCQQGGGYVYVLSVLKGGKVTTVTVPANR